MKASTIFVTIITAVIAVVTAVPVAAPGLQDIATQSCQETAQALNETIKKRAMGLLHDTILEAIDELNTTLGLTSSWVNYLQSVVNEICPTLAPNMTIVNHEELSVEENTRLRNLIMMSSYVHFLRSQVDNTDLVPIVSHLQVLLELFNSITIYFGDLLPMVTCNAIKTYVYEDMQENVTVPPKEQIGAINRIRIYCKLETMLNILSVDFELV